MVQPLASSDNSLATCSGQSDEGMVAAVLAGDRRAFEGLVQRHYRTVYAVVFSRVRDTDTTEDVVQDAFIRAFQNLSSLKKPRYFGTWLIRIARNLAADHHRRCETESAMVMPLDSFADHPPRGACDPCRDTLTGQEERTFLRGALSRLNPTQREVILLHYGEGLSLTEVSERLGVHRSSVSRIHSGALHLLRDNLEPILREGFGRLCSGPRVTARVVTCIAIVSSLSAGATSASAASAAATAPVGAGVQLGSALVLSNITKLVGATLMKKTVVAIAAVAAIGASGYYINKQANPDLIPQRPPAPPLITNAGGPGTGLPRYYVSVRDSSSPNFQMKTPNTYELEMTGVDATAAINFAFGARFKPYLIVMEGLDGKSRKDIIVRLPPDEAESFWLVLQHVVQEAFQVTATPQLRPRDVYVLKRNGSKAGLTQLRTFNHVGERTLQKMSRRNVLAAASEMLRRPVLDEAALPDEFSAKFSWTLQDFFITVQDDSQSLQLTIEPVRKDIEMLVVQPRTTSETR